MGPVENMSKRRVLLCDVGRWQNEPMRHALEPGGSRILGPRAAIEPVGAGSKAQWTERLTA
jgi:hypothetical protein